MGAADRGGAGLGQADVADLALGDQLGQRADGVLDGRVRVDPVLVVQVDVVGAEPLERALDRGADVRRAAVEDAGAAAGVRDEAELRRHHHLVAAALDGPADELLVGEGAVDLGGVEVGDAQVQRPVDGADRLGVAACPDVVVAGHRHRAESYAGDVESAERDVFHGDVAPFFFLIFLKKKKKKKKKKFKCYASPPGRGLCPIVGRCLAYSSATLEESPGGCVSSM